jgi:trans-aconitate methyltransferase
LTDRTAVPSEFSFDASYYRRYYQDPGTRVGDQETWRPLSDFLFAYLRYLEVPVERVLDVGCGLGLWRDEVLRHHPSARYVGVEKSAHACRKYGWKRGSVTSFRSKEDFDLVICHEVMQYLNDAEAEEAIENLSILARPALYLKVLTLKDWRQNCDQEKTDGSVYLRTAAWYRKRLKRHFLACGGGLFLARNAAAVLYELEVLE